MSDRRGNLQPPIVGEGHIQPGEVFDLLSGLVDKNLVVFDEAAGRYRLLETVSEYAAFDRAWQEGRSMSLEQAIDYALEDPKNGFH